MSTVRTSAAGSTDLRSVIDQFVCYRPRHAVAIRTDTPYKTRRRPVKSVNQQAALRPALDFGSKLLQTSSLLCLFPCIVAYPMWSWSTPSSPRAEVCFNQITSFFWKPILAFSQITRSRGYSSVCRNEGPRLCAHSPDIAFTMAQPEFLQLLD